MTQEGTTGAPIIETPAAPPSGVSGRRTPTSFLQTRSSSPADGDADVSPQLLERARGGDSDAFCELCRAHEARLFRQAFALCGDLSVAEDLAQDTLVSVWKGIHRFQGQCRFFTWLCSVLIHTHCNFRRKRRPASFSTLACDEGNEAERILLSAAAPEATPCESLQQDERDGILRRCLERLPEKHRDVVYLRFYVDTSLDGIAAALNCSIGTVKSRLFHALDKLSQMPELKGLSHRTEPL